MKIRGNTVQVLDFLFEEVKPSEFLKEFKKLAPKDLNYDYVYHKFNNEFYCPHLVVTNKDGVEIHNLSPVGASGILLEEDIKENPNLLLDPDSVKSITFAAWEGANKVNTPIMHPNEDTRDIHEALCGAQLSFLENKMQVQKLAQTIATVGLKKQKDDIILNAR